jgi:hypothetical protein
MKPVFWKLSQGTDFFRFDEILDSISDRLVYVHNDTKPKGRNETSQGQDFIEANIGDYFYMTNGNDRIYLFGQFTGPANLFTKCGEGWLDRPFRMIRTAIIKDSYAGVEKWWTPNNRSTFIKIPDNEVPQFEELILIPYFGIKLSEFGI